jgi:rubrerythrin
MTTLSGTKTEQNLLKAFAGESQARNRYSYFAKIAKKEGYEQISAIFLETAEQERSHAKIFFSFLEGGEVEITAKYPAGIISTTLENLKAAANGENEEWTMLYKEFSEIAYQEGFNKIGAAFKLIAKVEEQHEIRYRKLISNIENEQVFMKKEKVKWMCRECGYVHEGDKALENCPVCNHPKAYFEVKAENY